ncbi:hypothetical protein [Halobacillus sp. Marseille-Q1614]|uniref:hypothetical protein n=1 Tax=Halobacillus sp. Marseille-Q1614 TaxID=2709134 RepID=UPI00156E342E|nr:hypothetical protein [Halobacillus sp. Marseille-Q1614]
MISSKTVPKFSYDIELYESYLFDLSLNKKHPINQPTFMMLSKVDGRRTFEEIMAMLQADYPDADPQLIEQDFTTLLLSMKRHLLIDLPGTLKEKLRQASISMMNPMVREFSYQRHSFQGFSFMKILFSLTWITLRKMMPILLLFLLLACGLIMMSGQTPLIIYPVSLLVVILSIILSIAVHEAAHLYLLRRLTKNPNLGHIKEQVLTLKVVRPQMEEDLQVITAGPLLTASVGGAGLWLTMLVTQPFWHLTLHVCAGIFLLHLLYLLPFIGDGRNFKYSINEREFLL